MSPKLGHERPPDWEAQVRAWVVKYESITEWGDDTHKEFTRWVMQPWVGNTLFSAEGTALCNRIREERRNT